MGFSYINSPVTFQQQSRNMGGLPGDEPPHKRRRLSEGEVRRQSTTSDPASTSNMSGLEDESSSPDPSDAQDFTIRRGYTFKRSGEPPRNSEGKYICKVDERCRSQVFDRKCEWGKHMDKHERPYRCDRPECSKLNGFTYSGGLLRHQREVHKMHGSTIKLFCPEPNCKRAGGSGFTRKENLHEHLRRVHRRTSTATQDETGSVHSIARAPTTDDYEPIAPKQAVPVKRLYTTEDDHVTADPADEVRTLRQQISQRDAIIMDQREQIKKLEERLDKLNSVGQGG